jgi:hypothetical protein
VNAESVRDDLLEVKVIVDAGERNPGNCQVVITLKT